MKVTLKVLESNGRSLYLYYPSGQPRSPFRRSSLMVLRDGADEASAVSLLGDGGLVDFADRHDVILAFPNPSAGGWNHTLAPDGPDDLAVLVDMLSCLDVDRPVEPAVKPGGIPTLDAMLHSWHPMHDVRYLAGEGRGASMALTLAACRPGCFAAMAACGGELCDEALAEAVCAPMPAWLADAGVRTVAWFRDMNEAHEMDETLEMDEALKIGEAHEMDEALEIGEARDMAVHAPEAGEMAWRCARNPLQQVVVAQAGAESHIGERQETAQRTGLLNGAMLERVWTQLFSRVRRPNTGSHGDIEPRIDLAAAGIECHIEETLPGRDGIPNTWFVHVPTSLRTRPTERVPLMVFFHGGSDNPAEAAEMSRFHELGEREGFITVYPWGTNRASWNMTFEPDVCDDAAFALALIDHMIARYPVDPRRVYLSGFSNGAGMAMAIAMAHPERIAAICPIDSNWPGDRLGPADVIYGKIRPFAEGMRRKEQQDFRMPVWYTYGTREPSYPVYRRCTQQHQYDFWKWYNNIPVLPTPERDAPHPCGCGVPGDESERLTPSDRHPGHQYDVQRFFSIDPEPLNLYNYVLMRDKGHDIAEMDPVLGWMYVRQWARAADGSLSRLS